MPPNSVTCTEIHDVMLTDSKDISRRYCSVCTVRSGAAELSGHHLCVLHYGLDQLFHILDQGLITIPESRVSSSFDSSLSIAAAPALSTRHLAAAPAALSLFHDPEESGCQLETLPLRLLTNTVHTACARRRA